MFFRFIKFSSILFSFTLLVFAGFDDKFFLYDCEFYGVNSWNGQGQQYAQNHLFSSFSLFPPLNDAMKSFINGYNLGLTLMINRDFENHTAPFTPIETQLSLIRSVGDYAKAKGADGYKIWCNPMLEWDQWGGAWASSRPHYGGMTREQAYAAFMNYYRNTWQYSKYGLSPADRNGCKISCVTDYPCNTAYAYEMGVDMVLIERSIDELSCISVGMPFVRGLSRQYNKNWGIDISGWRTSTNSATSFDASGKLLGGWSPSYYMRISYIGYMGGAHNVFNEAVAGYYNGSQITPLGKMSQEFYNFTNRHKDIGTTVVNTALMLDYHCGFDPKHWIYCQGNTVWYGEMPYCEGDYMINNFLKIAYPDHWLHGLTPGLQGDYATYVRNGGDPRPYEPMSKTRYGDNLDIVYDNASTATLSKYKTVILLGDVPIDNNLRPKLQQYVQNGGILVVNARQVTAADEALLGVTLSTTTATGTSAKWLSDGVVSTESPFTYTKVTPTTATVIANNNASDPLITSNKVGNGTVIFAAPHYLQNSGRSALLNIGVKLFDTLDAKFTIAQISGPAVEYIVNRGAGKTIVTLVNNSGSVWTGTIKLDKPQGAYTVKEWRSDQSLSATESSGKLTISASVPIYEVRVYALEYSSSINPKGNESITQVKKVEIFSKARGLEILVPGGISQALTLKAYTLDGRTAGTWEMQGSGRHFLDCEKKLCSGGYLLQLTGNQIRQKEMLFVTK